MNEQDARAFVQQLCVSRGTLSELDRFVGLLTLANATQNLVAASTLPIVWSRHIADSAQLIPLAPSAGRWVDLGSGPGFPGLIVAAVARRVVTLVEERSKRVAFLEEAARSMQLSDLVSTHHRRVQQIAGPPFAVVSARAFAPLSRIFAEASHLSTPDTRWLLMKGRTAAAELEQARETWQGDMKLVKSVTDPDAAIVVATDVRPR